MREIIALFLILMGSLWCLTTFIGLVKLPDFFTKLHALSKISSFGLLVMMFGNSLYFFDSGIAMKSFLIFALVFLTNPVGAHIYAKTFKEIEENNE